MIWTVPAVRAYCTFIERRLAMGRGISESDVFAAADSLMVAGERPTVDRIRAVLGSGSPNTVIRHLDAWWAHAGRRLAEATQRMALPDAPDQVRALAASFWAEALATARGELESTFYGERAALEATRAELKASQQRDELVRAEEQAELVRVREEAAALSSRLSAFEEQRSTWDAERERLLAELQRHAAASEEDRRALSDIREAMANTQRRADEERQTSAVYTRSIEDRAHQAVDDARQEIKTLRQNLAAAVREHSRRDGAHARETVALTKAKAIAEREAANLKGRVQALEATVAALKPKARPKTKPKPAKGAGVRKSRSSAT
ncbi:DNA-binding protein [Luteibacter sp. RCC_6_2]|uniref:DNA-binding protein n=1 Tax=Luteibacter sp. RCC_6_2 TaxID=3239223 RepID=UPI003524A821